MRRRNPPATPAIRPGAATTGASTTRSSGDRRARNAGDARADRPLPRRPRAALGQQRAGQERHRPRPGRVRLVPRSARAPLSGRRIRRRLERAEQPVPAPAPGEGARALQAALQRRPRRAARRRFQGQDPDRRARPARDPQDARSARLHQTAALPQTGQAAAEGALPRAARRRFRPSPPLRHRPALEGAVRPRGRDDGQRRGPGRPAEAGGAAPVRSTGCRCC